MERVDFVVRTDGRGRETFADWRRKSERWTSVSVEERMRSDERA